MALITAMVLCTRSRNSILPVSVRRVHVVFSTAGFNGGGKPSPQTREIAVLRRGIQKPLLICVSFFKARIATIVLYARSQDSFGQCSCVGYMSRLNSAASCIAFVIRIVYY